MHALVKRIAATLLLSAASLTLGGAQTPPLAAPPAVVAWTLASMAAKSAAVNAYTFDLNANFKFVSFPWIRFSLAGTGSYMRGAQYTVHFTHVPWFGHGYETIKLDPLDPQKWPQQYTIVAQTLPDGGHIFVMHDRKRSKLSEARATIDPDGNVRQIVWTYTYGGRVTLVIVPTVVAGHAFPASEDADISMPHYHVVAHAGFTNYQVTVDPTAAPSADPPR